MDPNQAREKIQHARDLAAQGNLDSARKELESILLFVTDDPEVYAELGRICLSQGDRDDAEYALSRCLALDPDNPEAARNLASIGGSPVTPPPAPAAGRSGPPPLVSSTRTPPTALPWGGLQGAPHDSSQGLEVSLNASLTRRGLAFVLDGLLIFFATLPAMALFIACLLLFEVSRDYLTRNTELVLEWWADPTRPMPTGLFLLFEMVGHLIKLPLYAYYYYVSGQTPGKRLLGIRIVADTGGTQYLSFVQSILRYLGGVIGGQEVFFLGYLVALISPKRKALHDWLARTWVIESDPVPWQPGEKGLTLFLGLLAPLGFLVFAFGVFASVLMAS